MFIFVVAYSNTIDKIACGTSCLKLTPFVNVIPVNSFEVPYVSVSVETAALASEKTMANDNNGHGVSNVLKSPTFTA